MSCFVCEPETFGRVSKIVFLYGLVGEGKNPLIPTTLDGFNLFNQNVAFLNYENYSLRYKEEFSEIECFKFEELPVEEITPQDIKSTQCWMYQTEDYEDKHPIFKLVEQALEWAENATNFTKEEMEFALWR